MIFDKVWDKRIVLSLLLWTTNAEVELVEICWNESEIAVSAEMRMVVIWLRQNKTVSSKEEDPDDKRKHYGIEEARKN